MSRLDLEDVRRDVRLVDDGISQIILYDSRYIGGVFQLIERVAKDYLEMCSTCAGLLELHNMADLRSVPAVPSEAVGWSYNGKKGRGRPRRRPG